MSRGAGAREGIARTIARSLALPCLALLLASCASPAGETPPSEEATARGAPGAAAVSTPAASPGVVIGRVLEVDRPRAGTLVQLMRRDGLLLSATVDEHGEYQIADVPPGEFLLHAVDVPALRSGVMTMKSRGITVAPGALVEEDFVFGTGSRLHGSIEGIPAGAGKLQIALYRPGAPRLEGTPLSDRERQIEATGYLAGCAFVESASSYEILDVEPGSYRLVVTIPPDPTTPLHETWDPPLYEAEVTIGASDVEWPIAIDR